MTMTLDAIVKYFKTVRAHHRDGSIEQCAAAATLEEAIWLAAMAAHPSYKKHPHQWRLPDGVLRAVGAKLLTRIDEIRKVTMFNDLHKIVAKCAVPGFGKLAIYDTTLRIGMWLKIPPTVVYLHAGARTGAEALSRNFADNRLNLSRGILQMDELPVPLQQFSPTEVEDFLCVCKKPLQDSAVPPHSSRPSGGCAPHSLGGSIC